MNEITTDIICHVDQLLDMTLSGFGYSSVLTSGLWVRFSANLFLNALSFIYFPATKLLHVTCYICALIQRPTPIYNYKHIIGLSGNNYGVILSWHHERITLYCNLNKFIGALLLRHYYCVSCYNILVVEIWVAIDWRV